MPTPNQTTPDSPERTPLTDIQAFTETNRANELVLADFARSLERELNASVAETTRLAEALKEAEDALVRLRDTTSCTQGQYDIIDAALTPAPISGAKKE